MRNLAEELLTEDECEEFKQALHHFRVSHSVTSLCQQLYPVINTTSKILLLVELSNRMPSKLQEDFHRLCSLQFPNYETYLKIFTSGNASNEVPKVIAQDSSGKLRIVSRGSEKKLMMKYNNEKQAYELHSLPGTSITSGVYSNGSSSDDDDLDEIDNIKESASNHVVNQGRATPVHLEGKKNVHKVFLNRHEDGSLGLGITGGKEYGTALVINVVEEGGSAATQGLQVGDKILEVNGHSFLNITHAEAVMVMRNAWNLIMLIERPEDEDEPDVFEPARGASHHHIKDLELVVFPASTGRLGCVTQRLPNQDLIVKSIEKNSAAQKAGVLIHDLIYNIDGVSVRELSEGQIVMLTNAKRINLGIKRFVESYEDEPEDTPDGRITPAPLNDRERARLRSASEPRPLVRQRERSAESHSSSHHSSHHSTHSMKYVSSTRPRSTYSPHVTRRSTNRPEHLVYGQPTKAPNWIISQKPQENKFPFRREIVVQNPYAATFHGRSVSEGRYDYQPHHAFVVHEYPSQNRKASRYIRHRSVSAHKNTIQRVHHEDNVIRAIQMGLEKRQRAIRLSLYQMPDPADYEWEI